jgi:hypothetical protein
MLCPICHRKIRPQEAIFSMLPWWMTCRGCSTRLKLVNSGDFWEHFSYYLFIALATYLLFAQTVVPFVAQTLLVVETVMFLCLLSTVLLNSYGLQVDHPKA